METFMDQLWAALMSAFVVVATVCVISLAKILVQQLFSKQALKEYEDNLLRSFKFHHKK